MTSIVTDAREQRTTVVLRPRFEGANIGTWVGFKHFMYLAEEAVLTWFRERDTGAGRLYQSYGLGLSITDSSVLLPAVLYVDDEVTAEVSSVRPGRFSVTLRVRRNDVDVLICRGRIGVALVREPEIIAPTPVPPELLPLVVDAVVDDAVVDASDPAGPPPAGTFEWSWRAPYFYCAYSRRLAHSAYIRALEEVVDRFLADRGLAIGRMLAERAWIPVVARAHVRMLADAYLEETVHCAFRVTDVMHGTSYDARMDCYVWRDGRRVPVATATIQHAYAISRGPDAGQLAKLDPATVAALTGGTPA